MFIDLFKTLYSKRPTLRHFILLLCTIGLFLITWVHLVGRWNSAYDPNSLIEEVLENVAQDFRYAEIYKKPSNLHKNIKYLLLWNGIEFEPFNKLNFGQKVFVQENCSMINCYITSNRNFFKDIKQFDAIAFNGRFMEDITSDLPDSRSPHQKYIYFNRESADNYPVCDSQFDNFFNLTATYRLDSDIVYNYISIQDLEGKKVGPRPDMVWKDMSRVEDSKIMSKIRNKTKAVAWFVSNCKSLSGREVFVRKLQKALKVFNMSVDIYGSCGPYKCLKERKAECEEKLENDYYFYLSLENSFAEDYVTEKLLTALRHYTVPVVFGGANYSRFLPPGSYLDGRQQTPWALASSIAQHIWSLPLYKNFFKWRNHYRYTEPVNECAVCAALNNSTLLNSVSVYSKFRQWWNPNYKDRCRGWF